MSDEDRMREADLRRRLSEVLSIYGAEPGRWPPDERDLLISIDGEMKIARGEAGSAMAQANEEQTNEKQADEKRASEAQAIEEQGSEERALDRLLDLVDTPAPPDGAVERIIAAAGGAPGEVVAFSGRLSSSSGPVAETPRDIAFSDFTFRPAIGLVAASLLLGLITGTSRIADPLYLRSMSDALMELDESGAGILGLAREDYGFEEDDP